MHQLDDDDDEQELSFFLGIGSNHLVESGILDNGRATEQEPLHMAVPPWMKIK